jgi:hypothetical protein
MNMHDKSLPKWDSMLQVGTFAGEGARATQVWESRWSPALKQRPIERNPEGLFFAHVERTLLSAAVDFDCLAFMV